MVRTPRNDFMGLLSSPTMLVEQSAAEQLEFSDHRVAAVCVQVLLAAKMLPAQGQNATEVMRSVWRAKTATQDAVMPMRSIDHNLTDKSSLPVETMRSSGWNDMDETLAVWPFRVAKQRGEKTSERNKSARASHNFAVRSLLQDPITSPLRWKATALMQSSWPCSHDSFVSTFSSSPSTFSSVRFRISFGGSICNCSLPSNFNRQIALLLFAEDWELLVTTRHSMTD